MKKSIKLNGEKYPFEIDMYALSQLLDIKDISLDEVEKLNKLTLMDLIHIVRFGLQSGAANNKLEMPFTSEREISTAIQNTEGAMEVISNLFADHVSNVFKSMSDDEGKAEIDEKMQEMRDAGKRKASLV